MQDPLYTNVHVKCMPGIRGATKRQQQKDVGRNKTKQEGFDFFC